MSSSGLLQRLGAHAPPHAAIAVLPDNPEHTGILYTDEHDQFHFLHLAFHADFRHELVTEEQLWVLPADSIHPARIEHVAVMCERIWHRHRERGLPYGFRYDISRFRQDGAMMLGLSERGFTCATFVLAIFRTVGLELLKRNEWPARADDQERFETLLALLRKRCTDEIHIKAVSAEIKAIRYRALEVAGGSRHTPPASFADASSNAVRIAEELCFHILDAKIAAQQAELLRLMRENLRDALALAVDQLEVLEQDRVKLLTPHLDVQAPTLPEEDLALIAEARKIRMSDVHRSPDVQSSADPSATVLEPSTSR